MHCWSVAPSLIHSVSQSKIIMNFQPMTSLGSKNFVTHCRYAELSAIKFNPHSSNRSYYNSRNFNGKIRFSASCHHAFVLKTKSWSGNVAGHWRLRIAPRWRQKQSFPATVSGWWINASCGWRRRTSTAPRPGSSPLGPFTRKTSAFRWNISLATV